MYDINFEVDQTNSPQDIKRDRFLWIITENHVNDTNTVNHESVYLHHLRDFGDLPENNFFLLL